MQQEVQAMASPQQGHQGPSQQSPSSEEFSEENQMSESELSPDNEPASALIPADLVIRNIGQLVTVAQSPILGAEGRLQIIPSGAIAAHMGRIVWIGPEHLLAQAV